MRLLDKFRGCLVGGACGDALGYAVEFLKYNNILHKYGPKGITAYDLSDPSGKALISDDTQMTLFTAAALLDERAIEALSGDDEKSWIGCVWDYYRAWLSTQGCGGKPEHLNCWLNEVAELHSSRAPGNTCIGALYGGQAGTMAHPINDSKGCGGVMRVAPIGLWGAGAYIYADSITKQYVVDIADKAGAAAAAVTHGHELGYIAAAGLVHMVCLACSEPSVPMRVIVQSMRQALAR
ncbi:ADP-ribosylglycohydrolase family protein, partial [bacterium]|nr:ADP-ribosylglycohydrolase family protein [bacterium]